MRQDDGGSLLASELTDLSKPSAPAADAKASGATELGTTTGVMSFKLLGALNLIDFLKLRLTFPCVASTTSVLQILPRFVEVLGQKLDKISAEKDWL